MTVNLRTRSFVAMLNDVVRRSRVWDAVEVTAFLASFDLQLWPLYSQQTNRLPREEYALLPKQPFIRWSADVANLVT